MSETPNTAEHIRALMAHGKGVLIFQLGDGTYVVRTLALEAVDLRLGKPWEVGNGYTLDAALEQATA